MKPKTNNIKSAFSNSTREKLAKGTLIYQPEDKIEKIYLLIEGNVRQYVISQSGEEITIHIYKPSSFFPIMMVIGNIPNRFYFEASSQCVVQVLPKQDVLSFLKSNPSVFLDLVQRFVKGTDGLIQRLESTVANKSRQKIVSLLLYLVKSFGEKNGKSSTKINLKLSHEDFASWTGLTRETVSRQVSYLKNKGFISTKKGHFFIKQNLDLKKG
jgi:CRP/FNR family transcriptional regulator